MVDYFLQADRKSSIERFSRDDLFATTENCHESIQWLKDAGHLGINHKELSSDSSPLLEFLATILFPVLWTVC